MNQTARERVATAHTVDDGINLVALALIELLTVVDESLPSVERSRERLAQCAHHILEAEFLAHLLEDSLVAGSVGLSAFHVSIGLETKAELSIFLVTNAYVNILHQRAHDRDGLL